MIVWLTWAAWADECTCPTPTDTGGCAEWDCVDERAREAEDEGCGGGSRSAALFGAAWLLGRTLRGRRVAPAA